MGRYKTRWEADLDETLVALKLANRELGNLESDTESKIKRFNNYLEIARNKSGYLVKNDSLKIKQLLDAVRLRGEAKISLAHEDNNNWSSKGKVINKAISKFAEAAEKLVEARDAHNRNVALLANAIYKRTLSDSYKLQGRRAMENLQFADARKNYNECIQMIGKSPWLEAALKEVDALEKTKIFNETFTEKSSHEHEELATEISQIYSEAANIYKKEKYPDRRNHDFCKAMSSLFLFISSGSEEDRIKWETDKELIPEKTFRSNSLRAKQRETIFKLAIQTMDLLEKRAEEKDWEDLKAILVGTPEQPGLELRLKNLWLKLITVDPRAEYFQRGPHNKKMKGTLGQLLGVFHDFLGVTVPYQITRAYDLFTSADKHGQMGEDEKRQKMNSLKVIIRSGELYCLGKQYEQSVLQALNRYKAR
jgi:hypothetical protein